MVAITAEDSAGMRWMFICSNLFPAVRRVMDSNRTRITVSPAGRHDGNGQREKTGPTAASSVNCDGLASSQVTSSPWCIPPHSASITRSSLRSLRRISRSASSIREPLQGLV